MPSLTLTMGKLSRARSAGPSSGAKSVFALAALVALGCGAEARPARVAAPVAPTPPPAARDDFDHDWGERDLARVPLLVALPDAPAWHATPSGTFTLLAHRATHSTLVVRITLASRLVKPEQCEADARLARPSLPAIDPSSVVERRTLAAPAGFDVRLVVGVTPSPRGVHGYALAVGASTSRCYVAAFETESEGVGAAERVADRLAVVVSGTLDTVRVPGAELRVPPPAGVK
ncbi:MAG TPA: hypothetical protein VMI54_27540 [Polyangiaceae bacterium]|nr:hypothetical protein [Polyangiaceae bacterium]